jgi:hypothetical protein
MRLISEALYPSGSGHLPGFGDLMEILASVT